MIMYIDNVEIKRSIPSSKSSVKLNLRSQCFFSMWKSNFAICLGLKPELFSSILSLQHQQIMYGTGGENKEINQSIKKCISL